MKTKFSIKYLIGIIIALKFKHRSCLIAWKSIRMCLCESMYVLKKNARISHPCDCTLCILYSVFETEETSKEKKEGKMKKKKRKKCCMILISFIIVLHGAYLYLKSLQCNSWIPVTRIIIFHRHVRLIIHLSFHCIEMKRMGWRERGREREREVKKKIIVRASQTRDASVRIWRTCWIKWKSYVWINDNHNSHDIIKYVYQLQLTTCNATHPWAPSTKHWTLNKYLN